MLRTASAHTWISTVSGILGIVVWLTGLQTVYDLGRVSISSWDSSQGAIAIAILLVSVALVYGAFFVVSTLIFAQVQQNGALSPPTKTIFTVIGFAISFILYDTFFGLEESFSEEGFWQLIFIAPVFVFLIPYLVTQSAYSNAFEWSCGSCGKFTLVQERKPTRYKRN
jgi:hypothetical protein